MTGAWACVFPANMQYMACAACAVKVVLGQLDGLACGLPATPHASLLAAHPCRPSSPMWPPPTPCPSPGVEGDLQFAVKSGTTTGCSINLHYGARCRLPAGLLLIRRRWLCSRAGSALMDAHLWLALMPLKLATMRLTVGSANVHQIITTTTHSLPALQTTPTLVATATSAPLPAASPASRPSPAPCRAAAATTRCSTSRCTPSEGPMD